MSAERSNSEPGKEKKSTSRKRDAFLASWLAKENSGPQDKELLKEPETSGWKKQFRQSWNKLFTHIGATEQIGEAKPEISVVSKKKVKDFSSKATTDDPKSVTKPLIQPIAQTPDDSPVAKPIRQDLALATPSNEYKGELKVHHEEDDLAATEEPSQPDPKGLTELPHVTELVDSPLNYEDMDSKLSKSDLLRQQRAYINSVVNKNNRSRLTNDHTSHAYVPGSPSPKTYNNAIQPFVLSPRIPNTEPVDDLGDRDFEIESNPEMEPSELDYELRHETKDKDEFSTPVGATSLGAILASHPSVSAAQASNKTEASPAPILAQPAETKYPIVEPPKHYILPVPAQSAVLPPNSPNTNWLPPVPEQHIDEESNNSLYELPGASDPSALYTQAIINGFWAGIVVVAIMAVIYLIRR